MRFAGPQAMPLCTRRFPKELFAELSETLRRARHPRLRTALLGETRHQIRG